MTIRIITPREKINPTVGGVCFGFKPMGVLVRDAASRRLLVYNPGQTVYINRMVSARDDAAEVFIINVDELGLCRSRKRFAIVGPHFNNRTLAQPELVEAVAALFGQEAAARMDSRHTVVIELDPSAAVLASALP